MAPATRPRGRPRDVREGRVQVRLSDEERRHLEAAAARDGTTLGDYLRAAGIERAEGGGILIPRATADLIRAQADARGVPVADLAALIVAAATGWPRP